MQNSEKLDAIKKSIDKFGDKWKSINPESVRRLRMQNRFKTGLEIAKYTAKIMRRDMDLYDKNPSMFTQSLGCWHGFIGQQKMISIKKHFGNTERRYLYLSGWMIAALRSEFGPLPDQSMHEKTSVPKLIEELYTFLRQADARELGDLFAKLDSADETQKPDIEEEINNHQTHIVPICLLYTSPSPRDSCASRMPSSA